MTHCGVCREPITLVALSKAPDEVWAVCDTCDESQCDCPDCAARA